MRAPVTFLVAGLVLTGSGALPASAQQRFFVGPNGLTPVQPTPQATALPTTAAGSAYQPGPMYLSPPVYQPAPAQPQSAVPPRAPVAPPAPSVPPASVVIRPVNFVEPGIHDQPIGAMTPAISAAPAGPGAAVKAQRFSPYSTEVRLVDHAWQLQADGQMVKDFGPEQQNAWEAHRLIRSLQLTDHITIGSPPVIEFWLTNGNAPPVVGNALHTYAFQADSLEVELVNGHWCVRDQDRILFDFGDFREEAGEAVRALKAHGFNQVGYIGRGDHMMMVFFAGESHARFQKVPQTKPGPQPAQGAQAARLSPSAAQMINAKQLSSGNPFESRVTQAVPFDWRRLEVKFDHGSWKVAAGTKVVADFGTDQKTAFECQKVLQAGRCTERVEFGRPSVSFAYYLSDGTAPRLPSPELSHVSFKPEDLAVKQIGAAWALCDRERPLQYFGDRAEEATVALQMLQRYGFDTLSWVGPRPTTESAFWARSH